MPSFKLSEAERALLIDVLIVVEAEAQGGNDHARRFRYAVGSLLQRLCGVSSSDGSERHPYRSTARMRRGMH